jgi:hypothetical protein
MTDEYDTLLSPFDADAAQFLRHLLDLDAPLWVAKKGYDKAEIIRPVGWQKITCTGNRERLETYDELDRPFVCVNTGIPFAVFDSDTKNGGDPEKVRALLTDELRVRIYAEVDTPSDGKHFYIEGHPDLPTVHSKADNPKLPDFPGLDIQSHGANIFAPGTLRPKYGFTPYTVVFDELDQIAHTEPVCDDDDTEGTGALVNWVADMLAKSVKTKARKTSGGAREWEWDPCEPWDGTPPDKRQSAYLHAALTGEADKVAKTAKGGRNDAIFEAALKLGSYVAGAGLGEKTVIAALEQAAETNGYTAEDGELATNASIRSGLRSGKKNPRAVPPPKTEEPKAGESATEPSQKPSQEPPPYGSIDGAAILEDLRAWFARFVVVVAQTDLRLLALWVVHTYLCHELYTTPRLLIDSIAPGSGKTTLLEHLERLCRNGMLAVDVSSAALIPRVLDKQLYTVLLDEIHRTLVEGKPEANAVIAVVNSGYRVGAKRPVLMPKGRDWVLKELPTFAPVAMAGNSPHLPQDTIDRSIRILLMPDTDGHAEDSDWEELDVEVKALAQRASDWADSVRAHVKDAEGKLPTKCVGRLREKWRPLMRVAELADGNSGHSWKDTVHTMAEADIADTEAQREAGLRQQTPALVLLQDLYAVWPINKPFIATEELIKLLVGHNQDYWGAGLSYGGIPRKQLNATRFGRMVKQATNTLSSRPGGAGPRGYERWQFERAWRSLRISPPSSGGWC